MEPEQFVKAEGTLLAGLRRYHRFDAAAEGSEQQWREFAEAPGLTTPHGEAFGAICGADEHGLEYLTGLRFDSFDDLPGAIGKMRVPPQGYAVFPHDGRQAVSESWRAVMQWLAGSPYRSAETPDLERSPDLDSRLEMRNVEVWIGVREG
jgi:predicted transcriptional regulator YdeE